MNFAETSEKLSSQDKIFSAEIAAVGGNLPFSIVLYIAQQVCTMAREDMPGSEKKKQVTEATKDFILSLGFKLPFPVFLLSYIISPIIEFVYQTLLNSGVISE